MRKRSEFVSGKKKVSQLSIGLLRGRFGDLKNEMEMGETILQEKAAQSVMRKRSVCPVVSYKKKLEVLLRRRKAENIQTQHKLVEQID